MLVGPTGGGKSTIFYLLRRVLHKIMDLQHRACRFNPKAIRAQQMYGEVDPVSQEWTTGVFAAMWAKACNRDNPYNTWITADGPVDAIWIEDLNTVLDDNKILTLVNGDRMPMTDNVQRGVLRCLHAVGPNGPKIEAETTPGLLRWRRVVLRK